MARKKKNRVLIPDVEIDSHGYGAIEDDNGDFVAAALMADNSVEIIAGDSFVYFNRPKLAQLAELLRRIAEGEPLED